jgi:hypothetical protein
MPNAFYVYSIEIDKCSFDPDGVVQIYLSFVSINI